MILDLRVLDTVEFELAPVDGTIETPEEKFKMNVKDFSSKYGISEPDFKGKYLASVLVLKLRASRAKSALVVYNLYRISPQARSNF